MFEDDDNLDHLDVVVEPQIARDRLKKMGLSRRTWKKIFKRGLAGDHDGSHEVQALSRIAHSNKPKNLREMYLKMRELHPVKDDENSDE